MEYRDVCRGFLSAKGPRRVKATMGTLEKEWQCECGVNSRTGTLFEDTEPVFFCTTCVLEGKPREKYKQVDAENGKPNAIMTVCDSCRQTAPVKFGIAAGDGVTRNFCEKCYNGGKASAGPNPLCIICGKAADPRFVHRLQFTKLPGTPTFCKTTCSASCYGAVMRVAEQSQKGVYVVNCVCGKDITGSGPASRPRCARCKLTYYCSRECQKRDWKVHKLMCQPAEEEALSLNQLNIAAAVTPAARQTIELAREYLARDADAKKGGE